MFTTRWRSSGFGKRTRSTARRLIAGADLWLSVPASYQDLTLGLLPSPIRERFGFSFGDEQKREIRRTVALSRRLYSLLPVRLRYALPEAIGLLRETRRRPPSEQWISLSGADPLNLIGILTPGPRLAAPLRLTPHDARRMTRGQCGSLLLHCEGLSPSTPCRSPGAHWVRFVLRDRLRTIENLTSPRPALFLNSSPWLSKAYALTISIDELNPACFEGGPDFAHRPLSAA